MGTRSGEVYDGGDARDTAWVKAASGRDARPRGRGAVAVDLAVELGVKKAAYELDELFGGA